MSQGILALAFGASGLMKATMPMPDLVNMLGWPAALPPALVRLVGIAEVAAALGLVVPALSRRKPGLTPLAAAGLVVVMVMAAIFHIARGEIRLIPINVGLAGLASVVAWGRFRRVPIRPRS